MTLNIAQVAEALETDPKTARRFLRAVVPAHDHRKRWEIKERDIRELKLLFNVRELGVSRSVEVLSAVRHGAQVK